MSLDWYKGQKCTLKRRIDPLTLISLYFSQTEIPIFGTVYTVSGTDPCENCGAHIYLQEIDNGQQSYPCMFFRPVESQTMQVLQGLLAPSGEKTRQKEKV